MNIQSFPIKGIFIDYSILTLSEKIKIKIIEWTDVIISSNNEVRFMPNNPHHPDFIPIKNLSLEQILTFEEDCEFGIYTTNFSKEHEEECISKILTEIKKQLENKLNEYQKLINAKIKQIDNNEYLVERDNKGFIRLK